MKTHSDSNAPQRDDDDRLIDALLHEHARAGNAADEAFLSRLNAALDAEESARPDSVHAAGHKHPKRRLVWSLGIAAGVTLAAGWMWQKSSPYALKQMEMAVHSTEGKVPLRTDFPPELIEGTPSPMILPQRTPNSRMRGPSEELKPARPQTPAPQALMEPRPKPAPLPTEQPVARPSVAPADSGGFPPPQHDAQPGGAERYGELLDNRWLSPADAPLSTFSIDVDTASYSNLRRMILDGSNIPPDAVRLEEMVNYFDYAYPQPTGEHPFAVHVDNAASPWNPDRQLVRVALKGREIERSERAPANLVFLLDVSGSMNDPRKLPLVVRSLEILVEELNPSDTLSIAVYAGAEGLVLPATTCDAAGRERISAALRNLTAGGSTNGGAGIRLAYQVAREQFKPGGINRVILATDGDFNVGVTGDGGLVSLVEDNAQSNIYLTVLGMGTGNLNDRMLEAITNKGNGAYHYIDTLEEARRVFLQKLMGTLVTIAKDVKIQVEFNPAQVRSYRLLGYANRMLRKEDFADDRIDAGDIGSGHTVTAFYEIEPGDAAIAPAVDSLRYGTAQTAPARAADANASREWLTVKLRYKQPEGDRSTLLEEPFTGIPRDIGAADGDFRFASSVAMAAMILRDTEGMGGARLDDAARLAGTAIGQDLHGHRAEFVSLVKRLAGRHR